MPRHVNPIGNYQASKRYCYKQVRRINCKLLLADIQAKTTLEQMINSEKTEGDIGIVFYEI